MVCSVSSLCFPPHDTVYDENYVWCYTDQQQRKGQEETNNNACVILGELGMISSCSVGTSLVGFDHHVKTILMYVNLSFSQVFMYP